MDLGTCICPFFQDSPIAMPNHWFFNSDVMWCLERDYPLKCISISMSPYAMTSKQECVRRPVGGLGCFANVEMQLFIHMFSKTRFIWCQHHQQKQRKTTNLSVKAFKKLLFGVSLWGRGHRWKQSTTIPHAQLHFVTHTLICVVVVTTL